MFYKFIKSSFTVHARRYSTRSTLIASTRTHKRFITICTVVSVGTVFAAIQVLASPRYAELDAVSQSESQTIAASEAVTLDPDTAITFPNALFVSSKIHHNPFTLIGVGVRRISIFSVKVYSVGFYADLSNPSLQIPTNVSEDEKIAHIISNTACLFRIIPTRNTSFGHLRDGFMRALQNRISLGLKSGSLTAEDANTVQSPMRQFKSIFPNTSVQKGHELDMIISAPPSTTPKNAANTSQERLLIVRDLGSVESDWIAREFALAYFEGNGISPPMKRAVFAALQTLSRKDGKTFVIA